MSVWLTTARYTSVSDSDGLNQVRLSLPVMHDQILQTLPRATAHEYANSGHAPFWEEADRFNADLSAFVQEAHA